MIRKASLSDLADRLAQDEIGSKVQDEFWSKVLDEIGSKVLPPESFSTSSRTFCPFLSIKTNLSSPFKSTI